MFLDLVLPSQQLYTKFAAHPSVASVWVAKSILADSYSFGHLYIWYTRSKMRLHAYIAIFNYHTKLHKAHNKPQLTSFSIVILDLGLVQFGYLK